MARNARMTFSDAMDLAESMDLPDGAFWMMSHELAGLEYGEGFDQLAAEDQAAPPAVAHKTSTPPRVRPCPECTKRFTGQRALRQHRRDKHGVGKAPGP